MNRTRRRRIRRGIKLGRRGSSEAAREAEETSHGVHGEGGVRRAGWAQEGGSMSKMDMRSGQTIREVQRQKHLHRNRAGGGGADKAVDKAWKEQRS
eukprot:6201140-Pleurochrysis_carterae.AAC.2